MIQNTLCECVYKHISLYCHSRKPFNPIESGIAYNLTDSTLSVSKVVVQFRMATLAKGHKIAFPVIPAPTDRQYVMHLFHGCQPAFFQAHLAQRMRLCVTVSYTLPRSAILFVDIRRSFKAVILFCGKLSVFSAITVPYGKLRTSRIPTRAGWLLRHNNHHAIIGGITMEKFIPYEKLSKKRKRELDLKKRKTWAISPVTRKPEKPRAYNRRKTRKGDHEDFADASFTSVKKQRPRGIAPVRPSSFTFSHLYSTTLFRRKQVNPCEFECILYSRFRKRRIESTLFSALP